MFKGEDLSFKILAGQEMPAQVLAAPHNHELSEKENEWEQINKLLSTTDYRVLAAIIKRVCFSEKEMEGGSQESKLYSLLKEHFADDERVAFIETTVGGISIEYAVIKSLTHVVDFVTPIIPFIRKDPETAYIGFHDTSLYRCALFEKEGLHDLEFTNRKFCLHSEHLFKDQYWNGDLLDRLAHYGRKFNGAENWNLILEREKKHFPPKEVLYSDFRSSRVAVIVPRQVLSHMYRGEVLDFTNEDEMPYEVHIENVTIPPECFAITNIYHRLAVWKQMIEFKFLGPNDFSATVEEKIMELYLKYGIDPVSGYKAEAS